MSEPSPGSAQSWSAPPGIDLAWDVARQKLTTQRDQFKALDTKAEALIVLLSAGLGAYVAVAKTVYERVVGGAGLISAIALVIVAYTLVRFADAPSASVFADYSGYPPSQMKLFFINAVLDAIGANRQRLRWRALLTNSALSITAALGLAVVIIRASGIDNRGL